MKFFVVPILLSLSFFSHASVPNSLLDMKCRKEIEVVLKKNQSKDEWTRTADPQGGVRSFRSPTKTIAKWVEIQTFPDPYLFVFATDKTSVYQWKGSTCEVLNRTDTKPLLSLKGKKSQFTDEKLKLLVESKKPSMVYIWSPLMVYSMTEFNVFKEGAKKFGINFVPVVFTNLKAGDLKKIMEQHKIEISDVQQLQSLELYMRQSWEHFPSTFIVGNNWISKKMFGVYTPEILDERINAELIELKGERP